MSTPYNPENSSNPDFGSTPDFGSNPSTSGADNSGSGAHSAPGSYGSTDSFGSYGAANSGFGASSTGSTGSASSSQDSTSAAGTGATTSGAATSGFGSYGAADTTAAGTSNSTTAGAGFGQSSQQPAYGDQYGQQQYGQNAQFGQGQAQNQGFGGAFPQGAPAAAGKKKDGFFGALFDFSFRRFITIDFVKILYILYLVFAALMWLGGLILAFTGFAESVGMGLLMLFGWLIFGTLWALFQIVISRVMLEVLVSVVRIAQNTTELVDQGEARK